MSPHQQQIHEHEHRADRNRGVGDVECPEMPAAPVDVDEVEHVTGMKPVDQVAKRAAEDQRQADPGGPLVRIEMARVVGDAEERQQPQPRRHQPPILGVQIVEQAERDAGIAHVREIDQTVDHADGLERAAQNALLKVLEEPPSGSVFLLVTEGRRRWWQVAFVLAAVPVLWFGGDRLVSGDALGGAEVARVLQAGPAQRVVVAMDAAAAAVIVPVWIGAAVAVVWAAQRRRPVPVVLAAGWTLLQNWVIGVPPGGVPVQDVAELPVNPG